jgi:hypothetical protein
MGVLQHTHYGNKTHLLPPMTIRIVVRVIIRVRIRVWVVWVRVIISRSWSVTAFRRHYFILRKSDPTNRPGVCKMVFPDFNRFSFHCFMSDKVCSPPKREHFFFRHVRSNIGNMTGVAGRENDNKSTKKKQTKNSLSFHLTSSPFSLHEFF